jgi:TRAP transporter TAXI family solute receptor
MGVYVEVRRLAAVRPYLTGTARGLSGALLLLLATSAGALAAPVAAAPVAAASTQAAATPPAPATSGPPQGPDINDTTVGIVSGTVTGTYVQFASDLSNVLDSPGKLRILAVLGKGSLQNVEDILKVRGIDVGIVQSDVLAYIRKQGLFAGVENRLQYITKLYNEEFHLLAGNDIGQLEDLQGKKVNFGVQGSGIAITASTVFDLLKIAVQPTYDDPSVALEKLKRGEIAATTGVYGKPAKIYDSLKPTDNVKFLPVPPSLDLSKVYFPSSLTEKDYPNLIGQGESVETIAVGAVMVVFGWEPNSWRYNKVARFVDLFFANLDALQKPPRHQKWQEVNLGTKVPGWVRFPAADQWLKRSAAAGPGPAAKRSLVDGQAPEPKAGPADQVDSGRLFQEFEAWRRGKPQDAVPPRN